MHIWTKNMHRGGDGWVDGKLNAKCASANTRPQTSGVARVHTVASFSTTLIVICVDQSMHA